VASRADAPGTQPLRFKLVANVDRVDSERGVKSEKPMIKPKNTKPQ